MGDDVAMKYFLVVFDRSKSVLIQDVKEYGALEAFDARFEAEKTWAGHSEIEVVVLTAASEGDLKTTHSRYFSSLNNLLTA